MVREQTLAAKLLESGYELLHKYRDPRAGGRVRYKILIAKADHAFTEPSAGLDDDDLSVINSIVSEHTPDAECVGRISWGVEYIWTIEGSIPQRLGTTFPERYKAKKYREYRRHTKSPEKPLELRFQGSPEALRRLQGE